MSNKKLETTYQREFEHSINQGASTSREHAHENVGNYRSKPQKLNMTVTRVLDARSDFSWLENFSTGENFYIRDQNVKNFFFDIMKEIRVTPDMLHKFSKTLESLLSSRYGYTEFKLATITSCILANQQIHLLIQFDTMSEILSLGAYALAHISIDGTPTNTDDPYPWIPIGNREGSIIGYSVDLPFGSTKISMALTRKLWYFTDSNYHHTAPLSHLLSLRGRFMRRFQSLLNHMVCSANPNAPIIHPSIRPENNSKLKRKNRSPSMADMEEILPSIPPPNYKTGSLSRP